MIKFSLPEGGLFYEFVVSFFVTLTITRLVFIFESSYWTFLEDPGFPSCPARLVHAIIWTIPLEYHLPSCGTDPNPPPCGPLSFATTTLWTTALRAAILWAAILLVSL